MEIVNEDKTSKPLLSRRAAICTASAVGLAALGLPIAVNHFSKPKMSPQELEEFNSLVSRLQDKFIVREYKALGPEVVVYFTDLHEESRVEKTKIRIAQVNQLFPFEVIGFEGSVGKLPKTISAESQREIDKILGARSDNIISVEELEKLGFGFDTSVAPNYGDYSDLQQNGSFLSWGVESENYSPVEFAIVESTSLYLNKIRVGFDQQDLHIFAIGGRLLPDAARYLNAQEWLLERYPDYPVLDPNSFQVMKVEGLDHEVSIIHKSRSENFEKYNWDHQGWLVKHFQWPRNIGAAANLAEQIRQNEFKRAGLVFGLGHSIAGNRRHMNIQEYLEDLGLSYIVIDPVEVTIKEMEGGVCVTVGE